METSVSYSVSIKLLQNIKYCKITIEYSKFILYCIIYIYIYDCMCVCEVLITTDRLRLAYSAALPQLKPIAGQSSGEWFLCWTALLLLNLHNGLNMF